MSDSAEVVVIVPLVARDGRAEEGEGVLKELAEVSHGDPGCLLFALHRDLDDPNRFTFVERWESRELLEEHIGTAHVKAAMDRVPELFSAGPDIRVHAAVPAGTAAQGSLAGNAA